MPFKSISGDIAIQVVFQCLLFFACCSRCSQSIGGARFPSFVIMFGRHGAALGVGDLVAERVRARLYAGRVPQQDDLQDDTQDKQLQQKAKPSPNAKQDATPSEMTPAVKQVSREVFAESSESDENEATTTATKPSAAHGRRGSRGRGRSAGRGRGRGAGRGRGRGTRKTDNKDTADDPQPEPEARAATPQRASQVPPGESPGTCSPRTRSVKRGSKEASSAKKAKKSPKPQKAGKVLKKPSAATQKPEEKQNAETEEKEMPTPTVHTCALPPAPIKRPAATFCEKAGTKARGKIALVSTN